VSESKGTGPGSTGSETVAVDAGPVPTEFNVMKVLIDASRRHHLRTRHGRDHDHGRSIQREATRGAPSLDGDPEQVEGTMIIGITGKAGAGKDTAADVLVERFNFVKVALADPLKRICQEVFDFSDEQLWGPSEKRNEPDQRYQRPRGYIYPTTPVGALWFPIGGGRTLISEEDLEVVSTRKWCVNKKESGKRTDYVRETSTSLKMHQFLLGDAPEGQVIDHINGDGLDNRRENLRFCTHSENHANEQKRAGGSSVFKGVGFDASRQKWSAKLMVDGETKNLGRFDSEVAAANAYDKAALEAFGSHARLNSAMFLTPRHALQQLGTEFGRGCYDNVWVDYAMRVAKMLMTGPYIYHRKHGLQRFDVLTNAMREKFELGTGRVMAAGGVVIPDVRFKNEADAIRQAGGKIWRIIRPGAGLEGDAGKHASEVEQDGIEADLAIRNGLDIKTLIQMVHDAYGQMTRDTLPAPPGDDIEAIFRLEEDVDSELQLTPSFTQADGSVVLPNQPACLDRLSTLLEQRQKDVDAGKIRPYDPIQQDVAPFKRTR